MANAPRWQPDPDSGDQERSGGSSQIPGHGPQLHRALVAATTDIDAVESRLSTIFERSDGDPKPGSSSPPVTPPGAPVADGDEILDVHGNDDESDAAFAALDTALASEEPDEPDPARRTLFRRRT